ncbi:MAG: hypothetical protein EHM13_08300, partial [Acidobacteria bacterium]
MENPNDHDQPSRLPTLRDLAQPIFRQRRVVIGCLLVVSLGVATAVLLSPRVYEAELKILVKRDRVDSVVTGTSEQPGAGNLEVSEQDLMSEVELLKGRDLLERVVQVARLHERPMVRERSRTPTEAVAIATSELRRDLTIQPIRKTRMVSVSYRSEDRNTAQHVLDTFSRLYLEKHLAVRRPPGVHDFFTAQAEQSLKELRGARAQLDEFTARTHVVSAEAEKQTVLEKLGEFEAERRQAEAGIAETSRRIAALERELAAAPVSRTSEVRTSDDADLMREVKAQILALELKRSQLLQKFTPRYRAVQEVEEQLRQARAALDDARRAPVKAETVTTNPTREWVENEIARARTELAATTARARALGTAVARYRQNAQ